ncbi:GIY-YIG nuclease family protein [Lacibacter sp. H407]|uniref:GIY-YIG nuclease family protein n=1 Tax=Lacibacter sp. H407 TaxID=3133423 RepID=UPI00404029D1
MHYYVYILESEKDGSYYKGFSTDPSIRLVRHNRGETASTRHLLPWKLVYVELMATKSEALVRERNLKKAARERIQALLLHSKNIYKDFI